MCTLVEELSNFYDYFSRLSGFPDLFGKVFDFSGTFSHEQREIITIITMTHFLVRIYFFLARVLKRKKKKLALSLFYCPDQET